MIRPRGGGGVEDGLEREIPYLSTPITWTDWRETTLTRRPDRVLSIPRTGRQYCPRRQRDALLLDAQFQVVLNWFEELKAKVGN